jgi:hypothetical protein
MLASKRASGTGWKFLRPAPVMAGFLVRVKRGRIFSLRIRWRVDLSAASFADPVAWLYDCSAAVALAKLSAVVHGSSVDVKLASARMGSDGFLALWIGSV